MADIKDTEIEQFLAALASQSATPGGGSAAATSKTAATVRLRPPP